jgi:hypothetical protein
MSASKEFNKTRALFMKRASAPELPASLLKLAYLIAFAHMDGNTETAIVGQETLADELDVEVRHVRRLLSVLQQFGLQIEGGLGRGNAATYRIDDQPAEAEKRTSMSGFKPKKSGHTAPEKRTSEAPKSGHTASEKADIHVRPSNKESPRKNLQGRISNTRAGARETDSLPAEASLFKEEGLPRAEQVKKSEPKTNSERDEKFEEFWRCYPRKVAKEAARRAFAAADVDPELLIAGAKRYAIERSGEDPKYTKHPATWLNKGCWEDEASSPNGVVLDGVTGELVVAAPAAPVPRKTRWEQLCEEYMAERGNAIIN